MLALFLAIETAAVCEAPDLSPAQVTAFFEQSDLLNSAEWDYFHEVTDCPVQGEVTFHGKRWSFRLYQTGFGELRSEELGIELRFACRLCEVEGIEQTEMDMASETD
jgi:hypothetical protein